MSQPARNATARGAANVHTRGRSSEVAAAMAATKVQHTETEDPT